MDNENGNGNPPNADNLNELLDVKVEELDETALRETLTKIIPKYKEQGESNKQLFERAKKAEGGLKELKEKLKTFEDKPEPQKVAPPAKTGELDETSLDYLDVKGISEAEDIKVIEDIVKKTGMTVRQALKDDYVQAKLTANKDKREVKNATPSRTNRGGNQEADLAAAMAKFEATGVLPDDFELKSKVINAVVEKGNPNKPAWH